MVSNPMVQLSWWQYAVAGVVAILFGIVALIWPHLTLAVLILLFGAWLLIDGIVHFLGMFRAMGAHTTWWTHLLLGIIDIAAALFVFAYPGVTAVVLVYVIGFWAIVFGVVEVVAGLASGQFLAVIVGLLTTVVGFLLLMNPAAGALAYVLLIGVFAIVRGVFLLIAAFQTPSLAT